jgi:hypothetical protein
MPNLLPKSYHKRHHKVKQNFMHAKTLVKYRVSRMCVCMHYRANHCTRVQLLKTLVKYRVSRMPVCACAVYVRVRVQMHCAPAYVCVRAVCVIAQSVACAHFCILCQKTMALEWHRSRDRPAPRYNTRARFATPPPTYAYACVPCVSCARVYACTVCVHRMRAPYACARSRPMHWTRVPCVCARVCAMDTTVLCPAPTCRPYALALCQPLLRAWPASLRFSTTF